MEKKTWKINWLCVATCCVALGFLLPHSLNEFIRYDALSAYAGVFGGKVRGIWFLQPMIVLFSLCFYALMRGRKKPHIGEWFAFFIIATIGMWFQFGFAKDWREYSLDPFKSMYETNAMASWSKEERHQFFAHPNGDAVSGVIQGLSDTKRHTSEEAKLAIFCTILLVFGIVLGLAQILPEFAHVFKYKMSWRIRLLVSLPIAGLVLTGIWLSIFYTAESRDRESSTLCYIARKSADLEVLKEATNAGIKIIQESVAISAAEFVLLGHHYFSDESCRRLLRDVDTYTKGAACPYPDYLDPWMKCSCGKLKYPEDKKNCRFHSQCKDGEFICSQY